MSKLLLKNGRIICPATGIDDTLDLLTEGRTIAEMGKGLDVPDARVIDCAGKVVAPGLIDLHVHLREPGEEYKEDVASGSAAAAAGGFTAVACMPNTNPVNDNASVTGFIRQRAARAGLVRVYPVGAITPGLGGKALTEMADLKDAGCIAVTDDGKPVADARLLRRGMEYAAGFGLPVICHSEDPSLARGGEMHEGPTSGRLGLQGIPAEAEVVAVARDLKLARLAGCRVHIAHVSCAGSVEAIARAKARGQAVSAETAPHYLTLIDEDVGGYDTHFKMNPPLRSGADRDAVHQGLAQGVIDCVATDHAPHSVLEKQVEFQNAMFGVIGLETSLGVMLSLVEEGLLTLHQLIERMSAGPARVMDLPGGDLAPGSPADVVVIDPASPWTVEPQAFKSKSANCPYEGRRLPGRAVCTVMGGRITFVLEEGE